MILKVYCLQNGSSNGFQIYPETWSEKGRPLESDFYDIIMEFGSQNETQNLLKKGLKNRSDFGIVF